MRQVKRHIILFTLFALQSLFCGAQTIFNMPEVVSNDSIGIVSEYELPWVSDTNSVRLVEVSLPDIVPDTTTPPNSNVVGRLPYSVKMAANGKPNITIPIPTFATQFESEPSLALVYTGSVNVSELGVGWRMKGIPLIRRVSKNFYTDDNVTAIQKTDDDAFELDGERLVCVGDNLYETQTGYIRASYSTTTNSFTVYYPDGKVGLFTALPGDNLAYYISNMTWPDGREISYNYTTCSEYSNSAGIHVIDSIEFGDSRYIKFNYKKFDGNNTINTSFTYDALRAANVNQ